MTNQPLQLELFPEYWLQAAKSVQKVINVASVPQRSPFRYPGGKTWLIPTARKWFQQAENSSLLIEPFAGGGIITLTAIAEGYFKKAIMVELDDDMAAAWKTIFSKTDCPWLMERIKSFVVSPEEICRANSFAELGTKERGFATIVRNRTNHGGILARGSGLIKTGEGGKGLASRWYPGTLVKRIMEANALSDKITFLHGDAFSIMEQSLDDKQFCFFIDPPYTIAGRRLYNHHEVDHQRIFDLASKMRGHFLLTYDDTAEIRQLAEKFQLPYQTIPMQTTHLIT
ncbi:MAG: DNA adenine methylase, partial [Victivallales bacterium]|nr:DNA adenine methylase [Victivallales bacterium]